MDIEDQIHNLIVDNQTDRIRKFVLNNPYEINILETNGIQLKSMENHYYSKWDSYYSRRGIIKKYKEKYPAETTDVYLLGKGPIEKYELGEENGHVHVFLDFNTFKYIAKYPGEIIVGNDNETREIAADNQLFIETLRTKYRTSLFYCPYNTGILGIEGYKQFFDGFYKYLSTVDTIYLINTKGRYHGGSEFISWLMKSAHADKIQYLEIDVAKLYRTHPELIAYYRVKLDHYVDNNYLDVYWKFNNFISQIEDRIYLGSDCYRWCLKSDDPKHANMFPTEITHILNVSDDPVDLHLIPERITYEHYPIVECSTKRDSNRVGLMAAAARINELVSSGATVFVHCALGVNRSPAAVLMYFVKYRGMSLFDAYVAVARKRRIFTNTDLFDMLMAECNSVGGSPLKLRTNYAGNFCSSNVALFALYDVLLLDEIFSNDK